MDYSEIINQKINITITRDQLSIIRAAYSHYLDRQENITAELLEVESILNEFYPEMGKTSFKSVMY